MNEADTRANLVDPKLVESGWGTVENSYIRREVTITNGRILPSGGKSGGRRAASLSSDYVLEYKGRRLAAVETKGSDVYDVLAFVAYAAETHTRRERAQMAKPAINQAFANYKQQEFIEFVLSKYVDDGVSELSPGKIRSLIELKYNTISDAAAEFGSPAVIRETFIGFQKYLYRE